VGEVYRGTRAWATGSRCQDDNAIPADHTNSSVHRFGEVENVFGGWAKALYICLYWVITVRWKTVYNRRDAGNEGNIERNEIKWELTSCQAKTTGVKQKSCLKGRHQPLFLSIVKKKKGRGDRTVRG